MERIVLTWGLIPENNLHETIYCGDPETSGTKELNFEIIGDKYSGIDNDFYEKIVGNELWNVKSKLYTSLSIYLSNYFGIIVNAELIYGGYVFVSDEPDSYSQNFEFIESTGGVFNLTNQHNRCIYLRYFFEEADVIYDEKVCVTDI